RRSPWDRSAPPVPASLFELSSRRQPPRPHGAPGLASALQALLARGVPSLARKRPRCAGTPPTRGDPPEGSNLGLEAVPGRGRLRPRRRGLASSPHTPSG